MVSVLHAETREIGKKHFVECYAPWLKDGIFAITNISVEILMYIQIFILVETAFSLEGIQRSSLIIKNTNKDSILIKIMKNLAIISSSSWTRY